VSVLLDDGARSLLARAYAAGSGKWVMTRLADPDAGTLDWAQDQGINSLLGPDRATTANGTRNNAHTRWGRAFVRALYFNHRWYGDTKGFREERRTVAWGRPLQVEWGARKPAVGVIPAGRAVRVRLAAGGKTALRVVRAKPDAARIYDDDGRTAGRWADPAKRDWA
jgi:hypothetical protein